MPSRLWAPLVIFLVTVVAVGGIVIWSRYNSLRSAEISLTDSPPEDKSYSQVYIAGAVASPGLYPLKADDNIPISSLQCKSTL